MKLSTTTLECFISVSEQKGFSPAAIKLDKSQSAVSTQIGLLEKELNLKLFDRSKRPLALTDAGHMFFDFATEVLNKSRDFERYLSEIATGIGGEVKIGASTSIGTYILPRMISGLLRRFPKLKITVSTQPRSTVFESVRRAYVDFGLVLSDIPSEGVSFRPLRTERLCLIISPKHAFTKRTKIAISDLVHVPFVVGPKGTGYTDMITRILANNGLSDYAVAARISNFEGVKELVQAGLGVALLPRFVVRRELQQGVLDQLRVVGLDATASIMHIERAQHLSTPTILRVQNSLTSAVLRF